MTFMAEVVRIADRFTDSRNTESFDRQEQLLSCVVLVSVFYLIMSIAFVRLSAFEKKVRHVLQEPDISFELAIAPPERHPAASSVPPPTGFFPGTISGGSRASATSDPKPAIPVQHIETKPAEDPKPAVHHNSIPEQAPINVVPTNSVNRTLPQPGQSLPNTPVPTLSPTGSLLPTSGAQQTNGVGTNAEGNGIGGEGTGTGQSVGNGAESLQEGAREISRSIGEKSVALGNIGPYRKALLIKLAENLRFKKKRQQAVVLLSISKEGALISAEVLGADSNRTAEQALAAVQATTFDPLPDWFKGDSLNFKIDMTSDTIH